MKRFWLFFGVFFFLFHLQATSLKALRPKKDFALFFAVEDYSNNPGFQNLLNPVKDAQTIAKELETNYGFETYVYQNLSRTEIFNILKEWKAKKLPIDSQFFIFFSGHGAFWEFTQKGYFVPHNSQADFTTYIDLTDLSNIVREFPAQNLLLAIDACYSGTIDQEIAQSGNSSIRQTGTLPKTTQLGIINDQFAGKSRLLITSGGKTRTPDGEKHSPFSEGLINCLRNAHQQGNKLITFQDLLVSIQTVNPRPHWAELPGHKEGGFIFISKAFFENDTTIHKTLEISISLEKKIPPVFDKDGNVYPVLQIDSLKWLGLNLNINSPSSYCYNNLPINCTLFGRLYSFESIKNLCHQLGPGWRIPNVEEWQKLIGLDKKKAYFELLYGESFKFNASLAGEGRWRSDTIHYSDIDYNGGFWALDPINKEAIAVKFSSTYKDVHIARVNASEDLLYVRCIKQ